MKFHICLWLALCVPTLVCCSQRSVLGDDVLSVRDTNQDGVLSGKEAYGLKSLDSDQDDEISAAELSEGLDAWRLKLTAVDESTFKTLDMNEDGRLSGTEQAGYEFCDLNSDGRITEQEYREALAQRRAALAALPRDQMEQVVADFMRQLDLNEDDRLSGTEFFGLERYDANNDRRVTKDECELGLVLDAIAGSSSASPGSRVKPPKPSPGPPAEKADNAVQLLVDAANSQDASAVISEMRPELLGIVDEVMLQFIIEFVHKHHGTIQHVEKSAIETRKGDDPNETKLAANVHCEKDKLRITATLYDNKLLGFQYDSPAVDTVNTELYSELSQSIGNEDGLATRFAVYYSPTCRDQILAILNSKDDEAIAMFHPQVQESIGKDSFTTVFELLRKNCDASAKIEIETFAVEIDKDGNGSFLLGHRVTGTKGAEIVTTGFQIVGMKAAMVSVAVAPADESAAEPSPLQKLVDEAWKKLDGKTDDDDAVAPPAAPGELPLPAPPRLN